MRETYPQFSDHPLGDVVEEPALPIWDIGGSFVVLPSVGRLLVSLKSDFARVQNLAEKT